MNQLVRLYIETWVPILDFLSYGCAVDSTNLSFLSCAVWVECCDVMNCLLQYMYGPITQTVSQSVSQSVVKHVASGVKIHCSDIRYGPDHIQRGSNKSEGPTCGAGK